MHRCIVRNLWVPTIFIIPMIVTTVFFIRHHGIRHTIGENANPYVTINTTKIPVEVERTPQEEALGLSYRQSLATASGMLFVLPEKQIAQFWMKDMHFPLDFIWIDNTIVADITEHVPAPVNLSDQTNLPIYSPKVPVTHVLEVNAGFVKDHHIKVGDVVLLKDL